MITFMKKIIDLSHVFSQKTPIYPGDQPIALEQVSFIEKQAFTDFRLTTSMHVGTHVDGVGHMIKNGLLLSQIPIDRFCGVGVLVDARNKPLSKELFDKIMVPIESIVLVLTGHDKYFKSERYFINHPIVTFDFAKVLASYKVKMVGFDMPGPDLWPYEIHKMFFQHNIMIIENLTCLDQLVGVMYFEVYALPLKVDADSALARVIAVY